MAASHPHTLHPPRSPLVVQVGFAGSRLMYDAKVHPNLDEAAFNQDIENYLASALERLPKELGLVDSHFLCGISSAAIGADSRFINACARRGIAQRIFLPENRAAFLAAPDYKDHGSDGKGDFTEAQKAEAHRLLSSPHIIEERIVSHSNKREQRFEDVNLEIVRVSSVLIALSREAAQGKRGGTRDLIDRARARKKLVLEITVSVQDGRATFTEQWHPAPPQPAEPGTVAPHVPGVPAVIAEFSHKDQEGYADALLKFTGARAQENQSLFKSGAQVIIRTHVLATILSTALLAFHLPWWCSVGILAFECYLLLRGFRRHSYLHKAGVVERWATSRLLAEVARSVAAVVGVRRYLQHLFVLPLPETIRHVLRTLNFLHLKETCGLSSDNWSARRDAYVKNRLADKDSGQISYYTFQRDKAKSDLARAQRAFKAGSGCAIIFVAIEIILAVAQIDPSHLLGFATVVLPVLAVAALSLAASLDLEARVHSYGEMVESLEVLKKHLESANSEGEFHTLAIQTEARLVGENAAWYSRRVFISVT